jgi:hypothetical protein
MILFPGHQQDCGAVFYMRLFIRQQKSKCGCYCWRIPSALPCLIGWAAGDENIGRVGFVWIQILVAVSAFLGSLWIAYKIIAQV